MWILGVLVMIGVLLWWYVWRDEPGSTQVDPPAPAEPVGLVEAPPPRLPPMPPRLPPRPLDPPPLPAAIAPPLPSVQISAPMVAPVPAPASEPEPPLVQAPAADDLGSDELVVLDIETTGLNPHRNKITEIAALKLPVARLGDGDPPMQTMSSLIRISGKVPPRIVELTGITDAMLKAEGRPLADVLQELAQFVGSCPVVAYNAPFDRGFLSAAMAQHGIAFNPEWICALKMARAAWPGAVSHKLADLTRPMDVAAHRAAGDCMRARVVYAVAVEDLGRFRP